MNGHRQSGGHWKTAFGLMASGSDFVGSLGSGEESKNGILFTMRNPSLSGAAAHQFPLDYGVAFSSSFTFSRSGHLAKR